MKFGGAAMANASRFACISQLILRRLETFPKLVVVVSAMGETTSELMNLAREVSTNPPKREQDMLISAGERVSMALLAMALHEVRVDAISFTGSQSGILTTEMHTEAKVIAIRPKRVEQALKEGKVVIVAGFQGVSSSKEVTTLGRGGSDTSAVALAIGLGAERVEFYKDVPGIGEDNPKIYPDTEIFSHLSYEEALAVVGKGAEVLHDRCIRLAQKNGIPLEIRPFYDPERVGTSIGLGAERNFAFFYEGESDLTFGEDQPY